MTASQSMITTDHFRLPWAVGTSATEPQERRWGGGGGGGGYWGSSLGHHRFGNCLLDSVNCFRINWKIFCFRGEPTSLGREI